MKPKKSETLEIRLSHPLKEAFRARCRSDHSSASEVVRAMIEAHLAAPLDTGAARWKRRTTIRVGIAVAAALGVGAVAAPSLARPSPQATFAMMDTNHTGRLLFDQFAAAASVQTSVTFTAKAQVMPALFYGGPDRRPDLLDAKLRRDILHRQFDAIDANHDGEITAEEFRRYAED